MTQDVEQAQGLLDVADVARLYRVAEKTVWAWVRKNRLPSPVVRRKNYTRWNAAEVHQHIASLRTAELQEAAT